MWLVTTTALLVGLLTVGIESAAGNPYEVVSVEPADVETVAAETDQRPTVVHSGMQWSVSEVRIVPRTDDIYSRPILILEAVLVNTTDTALRVRESDMSIVDFEGQEHDVDRFDTGKILSSFQVEPGEAVSTTIVFKLRMNENPDLEDLVLQIAEPGRIPALLPLVGSAIESGYPVEGTISSEASVIDDPDDEDQSLVLRPQSASVDIDHGPYRAAIDEQLTIIEVHVQRASATPDSGFFQSDFWQLSVDGKELHPVRVEKSDVVAVNEDEVTLLFILAPGDDIDEMTLTAGGDESNATYPIALQLSS